MGNGDCWLNALLWTRDKMAGAGLYLRNNEVYELILDRKDEVESALAHLGGEITWDDSAASKKSRALTVRKPADFGEADLSAVYEWMVDCMFALRNIGVEML